jgi:hypothetical protein
MSSSIKRFSPTTLPNVAQITTLQSGLTDNLTMTYQAGTNKLITTTDVAPTKFRSQGFNQVASPASTLNSYDAAGNMTYSHAKGATIVYNFLNRPSTITFQDGSKIIKTYDAGGMKLTATKQNCVGTILQTQQYLGGIEITKLMFSTIKSKIQLLKKFPMS